MTDRNLQNKVIEKINSLWSDAEKMYNRNFSFPKIKFTKRGIVAGTANWGKNVLNFNMVLLKENENTFLNQTVPHEVAHLIARQLYGRIKPHGKEWKSVMIRLGAKPNRCHDYDTSNSTVYRKAQYKYICGCSTHLIGPTRHRRAMNGSRYTCLKCKGRIMFVGKVNSVKKG